MPLLPEISGVMPTVTDAIPIIDCVAGIALIRSRVRTVCEDTFCTSTTGLAALTTTVSSIAAVGKSPLIVAVNPALRSIFSRRTAVKPVSVNVTE